MRPGVRGAGRRERKGRAWVRAPPGRGVCMPGPSLDHPDGSVCLESGRGLSHLRAADSLFTQHHQGPRGSETTQTDEGQRPRASGEEHAVRTGTRQARQRGPSWTSRCGTKESRCGWLSHGPQRPILNQHGYVTSRGKRGSVPAVKAFEKGGYPGHAGGPM